MQTVCHAKPRATCLQHLLTLARLSIPMLASASSPRASIRMDNADLAASTREIFPLNLGAAWPMSDAWYINPYLGVSCFVFNTLKSACRQETNTQNSVIVHVEMCHNGSETKNSSSVSDTIILPWILSVVSGGELTKNSSQWWTLQEWGVSYLLSTQNLHSAGRILGQIHETTSMSNETCTNKLPNHNRQIWSNCIHATPQVVKKLCSIFRKLNHLVTKGLDVQHIMVTNLCSHRDDCCFFHLWLHFFCQYLFKIKI